MAAAATAGGKTTSIKYSEESNRCWSDLPYDVLRLIYLRLDFKSRCIFKSVCTCWNSVASSLPAYESPCLMIPQEDGRWKLFDPIHNEYHSLECSALMDAEILSSKFAWILASSSGASGHLFFFNPLTKQKMAVPPNLSMVDGPLSLVSASFSSSPISSDCSVFCIYSARSADRDRVYCAFLRFGEGDRRWTPLLFDRVWRSEYIFGSCITDSMVYYIDEFADITLINLSSRYVFYDDALQYFQVVEVVIMEIFLLEVAGEIWGVFVVLIEESENEEFENGNDDNGRRLIWVYKLVHSFEGCEFSNRWKVMDDLENKCLYLGHHGSFATEASDEKATSNTIYFNSIDDKNGKISRCSYVRMRGQPLVIDSYYPHSHPPSLDEVSIWIQPGH